MAVTLVSVQPVPPRVCAVRGPQCTGYVEAGRNAFRCLRCAAQRSTTRRTRGDTYRRRQTQIDVS